MFEFNIGTRRQPLRAGGIVLLSHIASDRDAPDAVGCITAENNIPPGLREPFSSSVNVLISRHLGSGRNFRILNRRDNYVVRPIQFN